jgi:hypothetical protein
MLEESPVDDAIAKGNELRFDVRLQGEEATVFLAFPGDAP